LREVHRVGDEAAASQPVDKWGHAGRVPARPVAEVEVHALARHGAYSSRRRSCATASASTSTTQTTAHATIAGVGPLEAKNGLLRAANWPSPAVITNDGSSP